jgi:hypothetical protein
MNIKKIGWVFIILLLFSCSPRVITVNHDAGLSTPIIFHLKKPVKIGIFPFEDLRLKKSSNVGNFSIFYIPIRYFYTHDTASKFVGTNLKRMFLFSGFDVIDKIEEKVKPEEFSIYKFIKKNNEDIDFAVYGQIIKFWIKSNWVSKVEIRIHLYLLDVKREKVAWSGDVYFKDYAAPLFLKKGASYLVVSNILTESLNKAFENLFSDPTFKGLFKRFSM